MEGICLELSISRKIANLLGGELYAERNFGIGSVFILNLPVNN
ncbi:MAG: hypothetical protein ACUVUG_07185 [Candidatus Aminicenantia bacterium]